MDEFLKLNWRIKDASELEKQSVFITTESISESYVYKNLDEKIEIKESDKLKERKLEHFSPGPSLRSPFEKKSHLDTWQQQHCLKALKLYQSGKDPFYYTASEKTSVKTYNELQSKIIEENRQYLAAVRKVWEAQKDYKVKIKPHLYNCAKKRFEQRFQRFLKYPRYYKQIKLLSMSCNELESETHVNCVANLLEVGTLARFAPPNLQTKCFLNTRTVPAEESSIVSSKAAVSQDKNIEKLISNANIDIVTCSGSMKRILDPTNVNKDWFIPVIVKKIQVSGVSGPKVKKVVFVENPLPKTNPDVLDYSYYCHKRLLRSHFCQYEAFNFPQEDAPQREETEFEKKLAALEEKLTAEDKTLTSPKQDNLQLTKICHNVSYKLWRFRKTSLLNTLAKHKTSDVEFNLLVRCKLDACERNEQGQLQPVIVRPKLEFQLEFGASIPSKMELSKEWTSLFFRPFSNLYRVRLNNSFSEVVSIEKCSMQKINTEAQTFYNYRPQLGLGILQELLHELSQIEEEGTYLLRHLSKDGSFVALMKEANKSSDTFNLHSVYDQRQFVNNVSVNPLPIDVNYILPSHEMCDQMPGMFKPFVRKPFTIKKGSKNKKKKAKKTKPNKGQGEEDKL